MHLTISLCDDTVKELDKLRDANRLTRSALITQLIKLAFEQKPTTHLYGDTDNGTQD